MSRVAESRFALSTQGLGGNFPILRGLSPEGKQQKEAVVDNLADVDNLRGAVGIGDCVAICVVPVVIIFALFLWRHYCR